MIMLTSASWMVAGRTPTMEDYLLIRASRKKGVAIELFLMAAHPHTPKDVREMIRSDYPNKKRILAALSGANYGKSPVFMGLEVHLRQMGVVSGDMLALILGTNTFSDVEYSITHSPGTPGDVLDRIMNGSLTSAHAVSKANRLRLKEYAASNLAADFTLTRDIGMKDLLNGGEFGILQALLSPIFLAPGHYVDTATLSEGARKQRMVLVDDLLNLLDSPDRVITEKVSSEILATIIHGSYASEEQIHRALVTSKWSRKVMGWAGHSPITSTDDLYSIWDQYVQRDMLGDTDHPFGSVCLQPNCPPELARRIVLTKELVYSYNPGGSVSTDVLADPKIDADTLIQVYNTEREQKSPFLQGWAKNENTPAWALKEVIESDIDIQASWYAVINSNVDDVYLLATDINKHTFLAAIHRRSLSIAVADKVVRMFESYAGGDGHTEADIGRIKAMIQYSPGCDLDPANIKDLLNRLDAIPLTGYPPRRRFATGRVNWSAQTA